MSIIVSVNGNIQLADSSTGVVNLIKLLQEAFVGSVATFTNVVSIPTGPFTVIPLPATEAKFLYIKNLHATAYIGVKWTPTFNPSVFVSSLAPGQFIAFGGPNTGPPGAGIAALSIETDTNNTPVEILLAG